MNKTQEPSFTAAPEAPKTPAVSFEQNRNHNHNNNRNHNQNHNNSQRAPATPNFNVTNPSIAIANDRDMDRWHFNEESPQAGGNLEDFNFNGNISMTMGGMSGMDSSFPWEMIGLGLEEPLPPQETIDEL